MSLYPLTIAVGLMVLSGCASTLEYSRTDPQTGAVEQRKYRIGYGNEITDTNAGFSARPADNVVNATRSVAEYGIEKGGEALRRQVIEGAVESSK